MNFSLQILGSGSSMPMPTRFSTAQVLNILERFFLVDCGEGTQIQFKRYKVKKDKINNIFISHLHGDHFLGIFGIISSFNLLGRTKPLTIFAPYKLKELIDAYLNTFDKGLSYEIIFKPHTYNKGKTHIFEDDKVNVYSFALNHRVPTCGFLFEEKQRLPNIKKDMVRELKIPIKQMQNIKEGADFVDAEGTVYENKLLVTPAPKSRSFAFVSDTAKCERILPIIENVDLLYHEATFLHMDKKRAKQTGHSTATQAAEIAKKANVGKLVIGHFSSRFKEVDILLEEAKKVFENTFLAKDGELFSVI